MPLRFYVLNLLVISGKTADDEWMNAASIYYFDSEKFLAKNCLVWIATSM